MKYETVGEPRKTQQIIRLYNCQLGKHSLIQINELHRRKKKTEYKCKKKQKKKTT